MAKGINRNGYARAEVRGWEWEERRGEVPEWEGRRRRRLSAPLSHSVVIKSLRTLLNTCVHPYQLPPTPPPHQLTSLDLHVLVLTLLLPLPPRPRLLVPLLVHLDVLEEDDEEDGEHAERVG